MSLTHEIINHHHKLKIEALKVWLNSPLTWNIWWERGKPSAPSFGWPEIYKADCFHCIYCGKDLAENEDLLAESPVDHLVPFYLFTCTPSSNSNNLVAACAGCNGLKGGNVPEIGHPAWECRKVFIFEMRGFINRLREERKKDYAQHTTFEARSGRIWKDSDDRQLDYLK